MKSTIILILVVFFTTSAFAQWDDSKLSVTEKPTNRLSQVIEKQANTPDKTAPKERDFTFAVNPNFWTIAIGGQVGLPNTELYNFNLKFTDAIGDLKMAAMLAGRFKYKSVSLLYDMAYVNLSPSLSIPISQSGRYINGTSQFKEFVGDFTIGYRVPVPDKNVQLDVYGGTRVWSIDRTLNLTSTGGLESTYNQSNTWVDPVFGVLANIDFAKNWFTYVKGDLGGFGAGSEFTTMFLMGAGYRFDEHWNTSLGLKSLYVNYIKENSTWIVSQTGLLLSVGYRL